MKKVTGLLLTAILLIGQTLPTYVYAENKEIELFEPSVKKEQVLEDISSTTEASQELANSLTDGTENETQAQVADSNSSEVISGDEADAAITSGTFGTCPWLIDSEGTLRIQEGTLGYSYVQSYWQTYRDDIKKIIFEGAVSANASSSGLFYRLSSVTEIEGIEYLDTSNVTDMQGMFGFMSSLGSLDVSNFDTSNVTNMNGMFGSSEKIPSLDLSNFNTSKVTNMERMFDGMWKLESLDVSSFDTSNVTNMGSLFANTNGLTTIDVSGFDTSKVTNMSYMFSTPNVASLDVSNFDTSNVTNMQGMFAMRSITSLDLSNFDTSKVTNMSYMFQAAESLIELDLSSFDMGNTTNMYEMFFWGSSRAIPLRSLKLGTKTRLSDDAGLKEPVRYSPYTGKWIRMNSIDAYSSNELLNQYDGNTMAGEYVWEELSTLKTEDQFIYVGDEWRVEDTIVSLTNQFGLSVPIERIRIDEEVDTSKPGEYPISFSQGENMIGYAWVTVLANQTAVNVRNSTLYVGEPWEAEDNFESALNKVGQPVPFEEIKVEGTVDTTKAGEYKVEYSYNGVKSPAIIKVKKDQSEVVVKNSSLYVGDEWRAKDNFVSAANKLGEAVSYEEVKVEGTVDTAKVGEYKIEYSYNGVKSPVIIQVKENQSEVVVKNSSLYVGDEWQAKDNFISAANKAGEAVLYEEVKVKGTVDTAKAGEYKAEYSFNGIVSVATITVKEKEIISEAEDNQKNTQNTVHRTSSQKNIEKQQRGLPATGEKNSIHWVLAGAGLLVALCVLVFIKMKRSLVK